MEKAKSFKDLEVWQKGIQLAKDIYGLTIQFPKDELYGLTNQIRRAAVSVPANIAEGQARKLPADFRHFLRISLGSLAEVETYLVLANDFGYLKSIDTSSTNDLIVDIRKMTYALINSMSAS